MRKSIAAALLLVAVVCLTFPVSALRAAPPAQNPCPGNLLANPGFEDGSRLTLNEGTSLSSWVANGWYAWSLLGNQVHNREPEFKVEDIVEKNSPYRVHSGRYSQKFFTLWSTHTSGFYQRVAVPKGSLVTFTIWAQIYTGQNEVYGRNNSFISDLSEGGPGYYRVQAGIDPYGNTPPGFGAPPPETTVWSEPMLDRETRRYDADGFPYDAWVQLTVTTRALADHVTVYTKGWQEYAVKHNDSFWDDACLTYVAPTRAPTNTPKPTATPTDTPMPTDTPLPTSTPTDTPTPTPTATFTPEPTPTFTPVPLTATPTATPTPVPGVLERLDAGVVSVVAVVVALVVGLALGFYLAGRRQSK